MQNCQYDTSSAQLRQNFLIPNELPSIIVTSPPIRVAFIEPPFDFMTLLPKFRGVAVYIDIYLWCTRKAK